MGREKDFCPIIAELIDYATLAKLAYVNSERIREQKVPLPPGWEFVNQKWVPASNRIVASSAGSSSAVVQWLNLGHSCMVFKNDARREVVFSFQGTQASNPSHLYTDSLIARGQGCDVPEGFLKFLAENHEEFSAEGYQMTHVGHSLGGYFSSKTLIQSKAEKYDLLSITFDSPGMESNLVAHATNARINNFVYHPNFINCVNTPVGRLFQLPIDPAADLSASVEELIAAFIPDTNIARDVAIAILKRFFVPLVSATIASLVGSTPEAVAKLVLGLLEPAPGPASVENPALKILKEKLATTLKQHRMESFLIGLDRNRLGEIREVDRTTWPTLQRLHDASISEWKEGVRYIVLPPSQAQGPHLMRHPGGSSGLVAPTKEYNL